MRRPAMIAVISCLFTAMLAAQDFPPPPPPPPPGPDRPSLNSGPRRDNTGPIALVGSAFISGRVVAGQDGNPEPVRRATIRLASTDTPLSRVAVTDESGRFVFSDLPGGRYTLTPTSPGFVGLAYGATRPNRAGSAITVEDGQRVMDVTLTMLRGAVITGTVRDQHGEPVEGQFVNVMRYAFNPQTGERTLQPAASAVGSQTDDRGVYRHFGLPPGDYLVLVTQGLAPRAGTDVRPVTSADVRWATEQLQIARAAGAPAAPPPPAAPSVVYAPVFYPGTTSQAAATTVTVAAGEERTGIDLPLIMVPTSTVSGRLVAGDAGTAPSAQIALLAYERIEGLPFSGFSSTSTGADGTFTFTGVTPGRYAITARPGNNPVPRGATPPAPLGPEVLSQFGFTDVDVNGQDVRAEVRLQPGTTVSGRLAFAGETLAAPADLTKASVGLSADVRGSGVAIGVMPTTVDAAGNFTFTGVAPGRYRFSARAPGSTPTSGWALRSVSAGGVDVLDVPLEVGTAPVGDIVVTFSDRPAEVSGRITDAGGRGAPEYFIILFARDQRFWTPQARRIQAKRPSSDGRFSFPNTTPGTYYLAAVTDVEQGEWFDPVFLGQMVPAAIPLEIAEGQQLVQDIRVAGN